MLAFSGSTQQLQGTSPFDLLLVASQLYLSGNSLFFQFYFSFSLFQSFLSSYYKTSTCLSYFVCFMDTTFLLSPYCHKLEVPLEISLLSLFTDFKYAFLPFLTCFSILGIKQEAFSESLFSRLLMLGAWPRWSSLPGIPTMFRNFFSRSPVHTASWNKWWTLAFVTWADLQYPCLTPVPGLCGSLHQIHLECWEFFPRSTACMTSCTKWGSSMLPKLPTATSRRLTWNWVA